MKTIQFRGRSVELPENIDELQSDQYIYYLYLSMWLAGGIIDERKCRVRLFSFLAGLGALDYTDLRPGHIAEAEDVLDEVTAPFFDRSGSSPQLRLDTCRNLLPSYRAGAKVYSGPADWLSGLPFGKFVECCSLTGQITGNAEGDRELVEGVARVLYSIPEADDVPWVLARHATVLFCNVWRAIQSGPIDINGRPIDFSIIFRLSRERRPDDKTGWNGIAFEVAAAGVFGNIKELDDTDFWAVLLYLYKCRFEYDHENQKNKK